MNFRDRLTLAAAAQANVETGVLLLCKEALQTAIDDHRLDRSHLRVLSRIAKYINGRTAKAWPDRRTIAAEIGVEPVTVSNKLRELKLWGYLVAERERVAEANNRSLTVYTFGNIDHETIRREIQVYIDRINKVTEGGDYHKSPYPVTVTKGGDSQRSKVTAGGDYPPTKVTEGGGRKSPPAVDSNSYKELKLASCDDLMISDVVRWMHNGDDRSARQWLQTMFETYGQKSIRDAWGKLKTALAEGKRYAQPLQVWSKIAERLRDDPKAKLTNKNTAIARINQIAGIK